MSAYTKLQGDHERQVLGRRGKRSHRRAFRYAHAVAIQRIAGRYRLVSSSRDAIVHEVRAAMTKRPAGMSAIGWWFFSLLLRRIGRPILESLIDAAVERLLDWAFDRYAGTILCGGSAALPADDLESLARQARQVFAAGGTPQGREVTP